MNDSKIHFVRKSRPVWTTVFAVGAAFLLAGNLGPAVQGLAVPDDLSTRVLDVLHALPEATQQAWVETTGTPIEAAAVLASAAQQHLGNVEGIDSTHGAWNLLSDVLQATLPLVPGLPQLPALGPLFESSPQARAVGTHSCWTSLGGDLNDEVNLALDLACTVLVVAMIALVPAALAVGIALLVVFIAVSVAASILLPLLVPPTPPTTCPPDCPPPVLPLAVPVAPNPLMAEFIVNGTMPVDSHDVDVDGVPDVWDAVNLPSEAMHVTQSNDEVSLPDGLPSNGFALLVPPSHTEAFLLAADPFEVLVAVASQSRTLDGAAALDRIEALQGRAIRNALAAILHEGMIVHYVPLAPETPTNLPISGGLPADGTWLLVNTDPTRLLQVTIAGAGVELPSRAASHFSGNLTDYRWNFLNVHSGDAFCYDPTTDLAGSACIGVHWPGWLRAYSGHAANALTSLQTALEHGLIPFSLPPANPLENPSGRLATPEASLPIHLADPKYALITPQNSLRTNGITVISTTEDDDYYVFDVLTPGSTFTAWRLNINGRAARGAVAIDHEAASLEYSTSNTREMGSANNGDDSHQIWIWRGHLKPHDDAAAATIKFTFKDADGVEHRSYYSEAANEEYGRPTNADDGIQVAGVEVVGFNQKLVKTTGLLAQVPTVASFVHHLQRLSQAELVQEHDLTLPDEDATEAPSSSSSIGVGQSPWSLLGNASRGLPTGIGVDYLIEGSHGLTSTVTQVSAASLALPEGLIGAEQQRAFIFQGHYGSTPASPRNLTHLRIGIQDADGNHSGQAFLIDGKVLHDLLDVRAGDQLQVEVDEDHRTGFQSVFRDVNGDQVIDLLVYIPHFSITWFTVTNSGTSVNWWDVKMTGEKTGWLSGADGAVYRYNNGLLARVNIAASDGSWAFKGRSTGMHVVNDNLFYVAGTCYYGDSASGGTSGASQPEYVVRYSNGVFTRYTMPSSTCTAGLNDVWMNADESLGYAGGLNGLWMRFTGGAWQLQTSPTPCDVVDIEFGATGKGLLALYNFQYSGSVCSEKRAIASFNGTAFSYPTAPEIKVGRAILAHNGEWAVAVNPGGGADVVELDAGTWAFTTESAPSSMKYTNLAKAGSNDAYWFTGYDKQSFEGTLTSRINGQWSTYNAGGIPALAGISFHNNVHGLAVGSYGTVLRFEDYVPPIVVGTFSPSSGDTNTVFTADGTGTRNADGSAVAQEWNWGDATGESTNTVATHQFSSPGTYTVRHRTWQQGQWVDGQTWTVTISAATLNVGQSVSREFVPTAQDKVSSPAITRSVHYQVPPSGQDRTLAITLAELGSLAPHPYLLARFALDGTAGIEGTGTDWPSNNAAIGRSTGRFEVAGFVPAGKTLDVEVSSWLYEDANIKDAWGQRTGSYGNVGFSLAAAIAPVPQTPTASLTAGSILPLVNLVATAPHASATYATELSIEWGDGATWQSGYHLPSTKYYPAHTFARGSYNVKFTARDEALQTSTLTVPITVHDRPVAVTTGAAMLATQGTFTGSITDTGGAPVSAKYEIHAWHGLVQSSPTYVMSSAGPMPNWVATGLSSGAYYWYRVVATNDVASTQTPLVASNTAGPLAVAPQVQSNPSTNLGFASQILLKANAAHTRNVAYYVSWDTGANEIRYPSTGYVPWNQFVVASRVLPFSGTHASQVRMEDDLGSRSSIISTSTVVTGSSPIHDFHGDAGLSTATLTAMAFALGVPTVKMRFGVRDVASATWLNGPYVDASSGNWYSWTPTLDVTKTYQARVEMLDASDNEAWTSSSIPIRSNQPPTLVAATLPATVSHLGTTRFAVTYRDAEGDAPRNQAGNLAPPQVVVNGRTYTMHEDSNAGYAAGATYYYQVPASDLQQGLSAVPTYSVWDLYGRQVTQTGAAVYVAKEAHTYLDFESQQAGASPQGLERSWESNNLWHVTDAQDMPARVARGRHGMAAWFGNADNGNYDAAGATGSLTMGVLDLRLAVEPALSFSSYYETQDLGTQNDTKLVQIQVRNPTQSWWSSWTTIHQVSGYDGGFGAWRTQHVDLEAYEGKLVKLRFAFTANADNNRYLGWLIDDVTLGHDHDGDGLPDRLEKIRWDMAVQSAVMPVAFGDSMGILPVRGLDRTGVESLVLRALVRHPNPSQVEVNFGWADPIDPSNYERFSLYANGADQTTCQMQPWQYAMFGPAWSTSRSSVRQVPDGLEILLDLTSCPYWDVAAILSALDSGQMFFFDAHDVRGQGSQLGSIESVIMFVSTRTKAFEADGDGDGVPDGTELTRFLDPAGQDRDGDGVLQGADPDDNEASFLPAITTESLDYSAGFTFELDDVREPVYNVQFALVDPRVAGPAGETALAWTKDEYGTYNVDYSKLVGPSYQVKVTWENTHRKAVVVNSTIELVNGKYIPTEIRLEDHSSPQYTGIVEYLIDRDHPVQGYGIRHCIADALVPDFLSAKGWAEHGFPKIAEAAAKKYAPKAIPLVNLADLAYWTYSSPAAVKCTHPILHGTGWNTVGNGENGPTLSYHGDDLGDFSDHGLSEKELRAAMQSATRTRFAANERWAKGTTENGTYHLRVMEAVTYGQAHDIQHAWEWSLPANPGQSLSWGVEDALAIERRTYAGMTQLDATNMPRESIFTNFADPAECEDDGNQIAAVDMQSEGVQAGEPLQFGIERCVLRALTSYLGHNQDLEDWGTFQDRVDSTFSEILWSHTKALAKLQQSPKELNWYYDENWDPNDAPRDCALLVNGFLRRCDTYVDEPYWSSWNAHHEAVDYGEHLYPISSPQQATEGTYVPGGKITSIIQMDDYLSTRAMDWTRTENDYRDLVAADTRVASRQVDAGDFQGQGGKQWSDAAAGRMDTKLVGVSHPGMNANVRIVADLCVTSNQCTGAPQANIDFRSYQ